MRNKCFLIMQQLSTYYKDPRFQVNHSVTFFDNVSENQLLYEPNLHHHVREIFRLIAK